MKKQIADSLFQAKPTFVKHLKEIMAAADEIRTINFNYANPNHLYNLQEYSDLQVGRGGVSISRSTRICR